MFDRTRLYLQPLNCRKHLLTGACITQLAKREIQHDELKIIAKKLIASKNTGSSNILMMGAHVLRSGVQNYLIDLIQKNYISCIAINGAGVIHDFEFALIGATTESVAEYISAGQFGLWKETGEINDIVKIAAENDRGIGEAIGQHIFESTMPFKKNSILAAAYEHNCPVTVHVGIGYDIIHEHPNFCGASYGKSSYIDFLKFAEILENIEGGVVMNFGSAVMAPEVYLKALAMVRNVAHQEQRSVTKFTTLVCDLIDLPSNYNEETSKNSAGYYFRPWKTMLVRTVADGGKSFYVKGRHAETIPELWTAINELETSNFGG